MLNIARKSVWWDLLFLIPLVNIIIIVWMGIAEARKKPDWSKFCSSFRWQTLSCRVIWLGRTEVPYREVKIDSGLKLSWGPSKATGEEFFRRAPRQDEVAMYALLQLRELHER
jgi:hypothetical protein